MTLPKGYTVRPSTIDDLDAMVDVANAYDLADFGRADTAPEHLAEGFRTRGFDAERDTWLVLEPRGSVAAFAMTGFGSGAVEAFGRVHPSHVGRGLGSFLVEGMERRGAQIARERGEGLPVRNGITSTDAAARRLLDDRGYGVARFFWHMERGLLRADLLTPAAVGGVAVRPASADDERRAARAALDEAFRDHWGFEPGTFEDWRDHLEAMSGSVLLALEREHVVGAVSFAPTSHSGWIEEVGVRPPWRGRGIGSLLLRHAFAALAEVGVREARLNVDADNGTGATRLYERVGMRVRREWLVYEKRLAAAG